jgi:hypothetical protein
LLPSIQYPQVWYNYCTGNHRKALFEAAG